jgi:16S rRNA (adenine1518-N6/adenine1519-N6)-dimethyltransferase
MELTNLDIIKSLLKSIDQNPKKYLGQNFLIDKSVLESIVDAGEIKKTDHVIEIGPGLGVLTKELSKKARKVTSIELDKTLLPILKTTLAEENNVEIIQMDALQYEPPETEYKVIANIPYNITSPLINHFLQSKNPPKSMTLLVQLEVAEKLVALEPKMTILSLQVALFGQAKLIKKVSKTCFHPAPKVDSAIINIDVFSSTHPSYTKPEDCKKILKTAKRAFSQKRKKLSNTLPELKNTSKEIDLNRRPQTLSVAEWKRSQ